jgi:endonuclease-3
VDTTELVVRLRARYPDATTALSHRNAFELLVATILSAQCTDARVNQVTPVLFGRFPDAASMSRAGREELEEIIRSTGFYRNKAKSIRGAAARIVEAFGGEVPRTMEELLTLPGVARKTANVVLGSAFGIAAGVVVDTHVWRISKRLGLSTGRNPEALERALMRLLPQSEWTEFAHLLILHGRQTCHARKPKCEVCPVADLCPSAEWFLEGKKPPFERTRAARPKPKLKAKAKAKAKAARPKASKRKVRKAARVSGALMQRRKRS